MVNTNVSVWWNYLKYFRCRMIYWKRHHHLTEYSKNKNYGQWSPPTCKLKKISCSRRVTVFGLMIPWTQEMTTSTLSLAVEVIWGDLEWIGKAFCNYNYKPHCIDSVNGTMYINHQMMLKISWYSVVFYMVNPYFTLFWLAANTIVMENSGCCSHVSLELFSVPVCKTRSEYDGTSLTVLILCELTTTNCVMRWSDKPDELREKAKTTDTHKYHRK